MDDKTGNRKKAVQPEVPGSDILGAPATLES